MQNGKMIRVLKIGLGLEPAQKPLPTLSEWHSGKLFQRHNAMHEKQST